MKVRMKKGLSCLLLLALLLSALPASAWAEELDGLPENGDTADGAETPDSGDGFFWDESWYGMSENGLLLPPMVIGDSAEYENDGDEGQSYYGESGGDTDLLLNPVELVPVNVADNTTYAGGGEALYAKLRVDEKWNVSLHVELPDGADPAQYRVRTAVSAQMSERTIDRTLSEADKKDGLYVIPDICEARVYQLTAPIDISLFRGDTLLRHEVYSVRDYLKDLAAFGGALEAFSVAARCYGGAAQRWLDGQSFTVGDTEYEYEVFADDYADAGVTAPTPTCPQRSTVYTGSITGFDNLAARFQIGLDTALRFYFSYPQAPAALVFTSEGHSFGGYAAQAPSFWYVDMTGIKAAELADDFVVDVTAGSQKESILYSPFRYAAQHWNSSDAKLADLCRMLVAFGNAAADLI